MIALVGLTTMSSSIEAIVSAQQECTSGGSQKKRRQIPNEVVVAQPRNSRTWLDTGHPGQATRRRRRVALLTLHTFSVKASCPNFILTRVDLRFPHCGSTRRVQKGLLSSSTGQGRDDSSTSMLFMTALPAGQVVPASHKPNFEMCAVEAIRHLTPVSAPPIKRCRTRARGRMQ